MTEKSYVISETLLNNILNYLANQPYRNVSTLIGSIATLPTFTQAPVSSTEETTPAPLKAVEA